MIGLDPLTISTMAVLVGATTCPMTKPTNINVIPRTSEVQYDASQSLKKLQQYQTDTVDPYEFHGATITQAFMKGKINLEQRIRFGLATDKSKKHGCVWYDTIEVKINIDPQIVVAKEIYRDKCMKNAVIGHELKHVMVDREIVNKYARSIGEKLMTELKARGFSSGPIDGARMNDVQNKMKRVVDQILDLEYKKLGIERQERQREVDSLDEYERVDALCPGFADQKRELYKGLGR